MNKINENAKKSKKFKLPIDFKDIGIVYALLILWIVLFATNSNFRSINTLLSILRNSALVGIAGVGMTYCIIGGMIDLSAGTMMALIAIINIQFASVIGIWCLPITLAAGALCGLLNGLLVAKLKLPAFIATLAMYYTFSAVALIISGEKQVSLSAEWFSQISNGSILGIPTPFVIMVALGILGTYILRKTPLGRRMIAVGNSEKASYISGINANNIRITIFVLVGLFTACAAFVISSFLNMADADIYSGYEFKVITAVVLGGTAMIGGKGSIFNTIVAAIFLSTLKIGMDAFHIPAAIQNIVEGFVLLFAFSMTNIKDLILEHTKKRKKNLSVSNG